MRGSIAFFFSCVVIVLALGVVFGVESSPYTLAVFVGVSAVATAVEAVSRYGTDNLTIPLTVAFLCSLLL